MKLNESILKNDEIDFILKAYSEEIRNTLETREVGFSFFASSEEYFDSYRSIRKSLDFENGLNVTFFNDYSIGEKGKELITDIGIGTIKKVMKPSGL